MTTKTASKFDTEPFLDYREAVEYHFEELFLFPFYWVRPDLAVIAGAQEDGWTPEQFAMWVGKNGNFRTWIPEERVSED